MKPADVIALWPVPSVATLARDLGEEPETVRKWRSRRIPPAYFPRIVKAAKKRRLGLTLADLHGVSARAPRKRVA